MSFPESFLASIENTIGFEKESFIQVHENVVPITSIRKNEKKNTTTINPIVESNATPIPWCASGKYLASRPSFVVDPLWHVGSYYVQEASSMFIDHIVKCIVPHPKNELVLDLCAAPGGKTTLLLNHFQEGLVVANETIKNRNQILVENVTKWGANNVVVTQNDPAQFSSLSQFFDVVLVDAPCSGSGLFRRDPDAMKEWSLDHVMHCSVRQKRIVEEIMPSVKEGGYLIYSTCSYSIEEDENLMSFIANKGQWENVVIPVDPSWGIVETTFQELHGYRFFPNLLKGEGFFVTVFKKKVGAYQGHYFQRDTNLNLVSKKTDQSLRVLFSNREDNCFIQHKEQFLAIPAIHFESIQAISKCLYIKMLGVTLGGYKGQDFIPDHHLAMAQWGIIPYENIEVDLEIALQYLRRANLPVLPGKGWITLNFNGLRLGFLKNLTNRSNNYYPNEWRILNY